MTTFQFKSRPELLDNPNNMLINEKNERNNGRVNLLDGPDPTTMFKIQERVAHQNKAMSYCDALNGIWENSLLSELFFSAENMQIIQNGIRAGVYEKSGGKFVVSPPSVDTLKIIMRSIYLQYAEHSMQNVTEQIRVLNSLVLDYAIPATYNEAVGYVKYREDQSTLVVPLELPQNHDRDFKHLELKSFM